MTVNSVQENYDFDFENCLIEKSFRIFFKLRCTFVRSYNLCDSNIVDISGAHFKLSLSILILNSQYEDGARDVNNICASYFHTLLHELLTLESIAG